jgi:hypothetical protein
MLATPDAREIAALVPLPRLLDALGFDANVRTRRCACLLHRGSNPSAFSWREDGLWHCHSCGRGGDRIGLVRAVRSCSFREAVTFLAELAGVALEQGTVSPDDAERLRQELESEARAAQLLANVEHRLLLELSDELEGLRRLRRAAGASLAAGRKLELSWAALKFVADTLPRMDAAYSIAAFAAPLKRAKFALHPESRPAMIEAVLQRGFVRSAAGYRFGVGLQ